MTSTTATSTLRRRAARVSALAGVAVVGTAFLALRRSRRRNGPLVEGLAPDLLPWVVAMPNSFLARYDPAPPRRGTVTERVIAALVPTRLGERTTIPGADGAPDVPLYVYDAPDRVRPSGALVWIHGGGMITGAPWMGHHLCTRIARELGVLVVSVDYRLAPEDPFPAGPNDCFTALAWLHENADALGIDPGRVAVGGDSAGGGLAAIVAQMAHDRGLPVAFQALLYPMLDDRTVLTDRGEDVGRLLWTAEQNRDAWRWFHGREASLDEAPEYAAAARRTNLSGLAPAWIGVGTLDLFHDEDLEYAQRLREAGVEVDLLVVDGMPHAADVLRWVPSMRAFRDSMIAALAHAVGPE